jgi:hypothetical protein
MVDAVIIEGVGGGLAQWATEATSTEILKTLQKMQKLSEAQVKALSGAGGMGPNKKSMDDLENSIADLERSTDNQDKTTKTTTKSTKGLGDALVDTTKQLSTWAGGLIGGTLATLLGGLTEQMFMVAELNASGMQLISANKDVASGMGTFADAAMTANLSFKELIELQKQYGNTLNIYGIQKFASVSKSFASDMKYLGATATESSEFLAEYLDTQRFLGLLEGQNRAQQLKSAKNLFSSFDDMSKVLGISKKQMMDNLQESIKQNSQTALFLATAPKDQADALTKFMASFGQDQQQLMQAASDAITDPAFARAAIVGDLVSVVPGAINALEDMRNTVRSGTEVTDAQMSAFADSLSNLTAEQVATIQTMGVNGNEAAKVMADMIMQGKSLQLNLNKKKSAVADTPEEKAAKEKLREQIEASAKLTDSWKLITTAFERAVGELYRSGDLSAKFAQLAESVATTLEKIIPKLIELFGKIMSNAEPLIGALIVGLDKFNEFADGLKPEELYAKIMDFFTVDFSTAMLKGIAAVFGGVIVAKAIAGLFGKMMGMLGGGAGGAGGGLGGMLGGLGKGVGEAVKGIGTSIAAFGGPLGVKLAIGAAAIAAAIAVIGAGIGAAAWISGAGLSTFAESMKQFESLDSTKLSAVGLAIKDIGVGLAAFSAGGVVDNFSKLGSALLSPFTDDTGFIARLTEIGEMDVAPIIRVGDALSVFTTSLERFMEITTANVDQDTVFAKIATDINELSVAIMALNDISTISVGPGNNVKIGEKQIVQMESPSTPESPKNFNTGDKLSKVKETESVQGINNMQDTELLKKQLKVLANIAENQALSVRYFKRVFMSSPEMNE